jgi:hypothetical protein
MGMGLIKGADLQDVRETLMISLLDMFWLTGSNSFDDKWRLKGEKGQRPIVVPYLTLLIRYLGKYPEENFLPEMPDFFQTYKVVNKAYPGKLSVRKFGCLFGTAAWSANEWNQGKTPSPVIQRLFYLLVRSIEQEGSEGLKKYLELVDGEARQRSSFIHGPQKAWGLDKLMTKGSWNTRKFQAKIHDTFGKLKEEMPANSLDVPIKETLIRGADLQDVRESLMVSLLDLLWITGTGSFDNKLRLKGAKSLIPISKPSLSLLVKYLGKYPEENFLPEMPDFFQTYEVVNKVYPGKLSVRKFGCLFGTAAWSANEWSQGKSPAPVVLRLFYLLVRSIEQEGAEGLKKFLEVVDEEARERSSYLEGPENAWGLSELISKGSWRSQDFRKKIEQEFGPIKE